MGLNAARCPPVSGFPLKRKRRRFSPPPLMNFFSTPGQRRGLLPEQADIMESHAANLCSSPGRESAVD